MDKIAELVKIAEVNGVVGSLVDAGYITVASEDAFNKFAQVIAEGLNDNYSLDDVLNKVAEELNAAEVAVKVEEAVKDAAPEVASTIADEVAQGMAEDVVEDAVEEKLAALGVLALRKQAGEISEDEYAAGMTSIFQKEERKLLILIL